MTNIISKIHNVAMTSLHESHENSLRQGKRLEAQVENLQSFHDSEHDKDFSFTSLPTELDGKVKFVWSETTTSMQNCYVCGAKPHQKMCQITIIF